MTEETRLDQNRLYYRLNRYLNSDQADTKLARFIVNGYKKFKISPEPTSRFSFSTPLFDLKKYQDGPYYKSLTLLSKFAKKELSPYLSYFFIHGSLSTLDYIPGFSDLDTYLIVKNTVCANIRKLEALREKLLEARKFLKLIDPDSHHGFICCNETNLKSYCNAYMPIPVFRNAGRLLGPQNINFRLRDSQKEHQAVFLRFADILLDRKRFDPEKINVQEFKYFVAVALLLPTLYLQVKGYILYKKYSFRLYNHPFLEKASLIRKKFANLPLKKLIGLLGRDYLDQAAAMVEDMKKDIAMSEKQKKYINIPRILPLAAYHQARQEIINHFKNNKDVLAIYEYGQVGSPGISDLDLIVVTRPKLIASQPSDYLIGKNFTAKTRQIISGTLMIMKEKDFYDIIIFDDVKLKKLYGKKIKMVKLNLINRRYREIASVVDWLPERLTRLIKLYRQPRLDVHYALLCLKSATYALQKVAKLTDHKHHNQLKTEVILARKKWLKNKPHDLRYLIKMVIYAGYDALYDFHRVFFKEKFPEGSLTLFPWQKIVFTNKEPMIDPDFAISISTDKEVAAPISANLLGHFWTYSQQPGLLARQAKKQLFLNAGVRPIKHNSYYKFLKKKMALAAGCADFLLENNLETGLYKFGFYFQNYLKNKKDK